MNKKLKLIIPKQEMIVKIKEKFQINGNIENIEKKFLLFAAISQPEVFGISQEQFNDNKKHWIRDPATFDELSKIYDFGWTDIQRLSLQKLNQQYETGDTILWDNNKEEFIIGEEARDIYFPEEPVVNGMKAVWANRIYLNKIKEAGFDTMISFNFYTRSYDEQKITLETAKTFGIKIIPILHDFLKENKYTEIETLINRWKKNSAIGGWLLYDEPGLHGIPTIKQVEDYKKVKKFDSVHEIYMTYIAGGNKEYYTIHASDQIIVTCYPILKGQEDNYEEILRKNLQNWIDDTGNKNIIANMQAFHTENISHKPWANPVGTIQGQYNIWKELNLVKKGYTLYAWIGGSGSGSRGITEIPDLLEEVTNFNLKK